MDVMVDIETLGSRPGSAILQIAAVRFDPHTTTRPSDCRPAAHPDASSSDEGFDSAVNLKSCTDAGLVVDASTLVWWLLDKSGERSARLAHLLRRGESEGEAALLPSALCRLGLWLGNRPYERLWTRGNFDVPLLEAARSAVGATGPLVPDFRCVRDVRTLLDATGVKPERVYEGSHDAWYDCLNQVSDVQRAFARTRELCMTVELSELRERVSADSPQLLRDVNNVLMSIPGVRRVWTSLSDGGSGSVNLLVQLESMGVREAVERELARIVPAYIQVNLTHQIA